MPTFWIKRGFIRFPGISELNLEFRLLSETLFCFLKREKRRANNARFKRERKIAINDVKDINLIVERLRDFFKYSVTIRL